MKLGRQGQQESVSSIFHGGWISRRPLLKGSRMSVSLCPNLFVSKETEYVENLECFAHARTAPRSGIDGPRGRSRPRGLQFPGGFNGTTAGASRWCASAGCIGSVYATPPTRYLRGQTRPSNDAGPCS